MNSGRVGGIGNPDAGGAAAHSTYVTTISVEPALATSYSPRWAGRRNVSPLRKGWRDLSLSPKWKAPPPRVHVRIWKRALLVLSFTRRRSSSIASIVNFSHLMSRSRRYGKPAIRDGL